MDKIIVANWKMNGSLSFIKDFFPKIHTALETTPHQVILCPPFPFLSQIQEILKNTKAHLGAQNCYVSSQGAFTGEVSSSMLADMGCKFVIVGHSERRTLFSETNSLVKTKISALHKAGLTAILCVGESLLMRESGQAIETVVQQLHESLPESSTNQNTMVAYEPVWAIGTGMTPTLEEILEMHQALQKALPAPLSLLYGGSVTPENRDSILNLPGVDGVLVGGASLKADSFEKLIQ